MSVYENLKNLNLEIPKAPDPVGSYIAYKKTENLLFISGQISIDSNGKITKGKLGKDLTIDQGRAAAKLCAINIIAQAKKACNERLEKIKNCIKLTGYVNSTDDFTDQPKVINAASELISAVFEENGKHTRAAISANALPLGAAVEIDAIFEIK
jgi:enamine deaminase RidA (YjgF/YER057c/UK114 family)